jgi:TonB family protein
MRGLSLKTARAGAIFRSKHLLLVHRPAEHLPACESEEPFRVLIDFPSAPIYPPLAKQARIQGEVVLEAIISREGDVTNLRVVSGHPLLVEAALTAARQWKYRPTLLNGQPVEVVSQVTVPFKLEPENR